jgi:hypothetical protein
MKQIAKGIIPLMTEPLREMGNSGSQTSVIASFQHINGHVWLDSGKKGSAISPKTAVLGK